MSTKIYRAFILSLLLLLSVGAASAATGINIIPVLITNSTGAAAVTPQLAWNMSSQSLVDGSWMLPTALDTELQESSAAIGYMPGTGRVRMLACFNNAAVDQTTACNNATAGDITLPAAAAQVYEFAANSQFRHLWLNLSTAGVANWDIVFEYYNGAGYVAFSDVTDGTSELTLSGLKQVSWTFPAAGLWPQSALHAVTGYWMRIRVSAFTSLTTAPLGQQAYYETGRWWTTVASMPDDQQRRFDLHLDTSPTGDTITTFSVAAGTDDTDVRGESAIYPPAFSLVTDSSAAVGVKRTLSGGTYTIDDLYLRFNTSALPDHISPDTATLACNVILLGDANNRGLIGDWYSWSGTLAEKDYSATSAVGSALSLVDITTITGSGVVNIWALQNLYAINKSGYTGLRISISGGIPTGSNLVQISTFDSSISPECVLSVTYNGSRVYHNLFSHTAGWTVADNAALELGSAFEITWAGYHIEDASVSSAIIINKAGAIQWVVGGGSNFFIFINGVNEISVNAVGGYHVLTLRQVAAGGAYRTELLQDGVIIGTSAAALAVTDNATDWTLGGSSADRPLIYTEYIEISVGGVTQLTHQIRELPTHEVVNKANPGTFNATLRYPDTVDGFTTTVLSLEPTGEVFGEEAVFSGDFVGAIPVLPNADPGEYLAEPTSPFLSLLKVAADNSGGLLPYRAALMLMAFGLCVLAMFGSWVALHSVHVTWLALVIASVSFVFVGAGVWGWMVPISTGLTLFVYIFYRRAAI